MEANIIRGCTPWSLVAQQKQYIGGDLQICRSLMLFRGPIERIRSDRDRRLVLITLAWTAKTPHPSQEGHGTWEFETTAETEHVFWMEGSLSSAVVGDGRRLIFIDGGGPGVLFPIGFNLDMHRVRGHPSGSSGATPSL